MSKIEVWGTGKPLSGFTQDAVLTSARKLFPTTKSQHIARFIAGKRFIITRVNDAAGAQKLIDGLAKSGIEADTAGPPPSPSPADAASQEADAADEEELVSIEALEESSELDAPIAAAPPQGRRSLLSQWKKLAAGGAALVIIAVVAVLVIRQRQEASELTMQARIEATTRASLAAKRQIEAYVQKQAEAEAAAKAKAQLEEAQRLAKQDAALTEINSAFADGDYPSVILLAEKYELSYGMDDRVTKLSQNATFNLQEGARRGNFAAILNAPIKGSVRFDALRQWALQVQERAKPQH